MNKSIRVVDPEEEDVIRSHHTAAKPDLTADEQEANDHGVKPELDEQAAHEEITQALIAGLMSMRI